MSIKVENLRFPSIGIRRHRIVTDSFGVTTLVAAHGCTLRCRHCLNPQCFQTKEAAAVYTLESLLEKVKIDDLYFQATGGGIVFGGGEPLLYADYIHAFKSLCPSSWKLSLETSLALPQIKLLQVIDDIDYFIVDIKDMHPAVYKAYTGSSPDNMLANLAYLKSHVPADHIRIRVPLIPAYNTPEDQADSVHILQAMGFQNIETFSYVIRENLS